MMELCLNLLVVQTLMGAFDTLYHHEISEALPQRCNAKRELQIHAVRAILYGVVFLGLGWLEWHGLWSVVLAAIILTEVILTLWDFVIEDQTRLLPASERVLHTLLAINGGAAFVLLATELPAWYQQSSGLVATDYGWQSWFFTLAAIGVTASGIRDARAAIHIHRLTNKLPLDWGGEHQRFLITGGTGFIGSALCRELVHAGHDVTIVSRRPLAAAMQFSGRVRVVSRFEQLSTAEVMDVVINLAGAPVIGPLWTRARKRVLTQSRLSTTRSLLDFTRQLKHKPRLWIQASAIGYYGTDSEAVVDEDSPAGQGFAASLCKQWEQLAHSLEGDSIRMVILRFGVVFGRSGGAFPMLLLAQRFGLGVIYGSGRQHVSWIHLADLLQILSMTIRDPVMTGVINAVAPESPSQETFVAVAGRILHRPFRIRIPEKMLRFVLGEMASMFVDGPCVRPKRMEAMQLNYRYPDLIAAIKNLA